jgi:hypothetical protein
MGVLSGQSSNPQMPEIRCEDPENDVNRCGKYMLEVASLLFIAISHNLGAVLLAAFFRSAYSLLFPSRQATLHVGESVILNWYFGMRVNLCCDPRLVSLQAGGFWTGVSGCLCRVTNGNPPVQFRGCFAGLEDIPFPQTLPPHPHRGVGWAVRVG